ncbi:MAG: acetyl-CoA synthetase [Ruminococcaceae bacterium]|nr:acetyl-CoA synthetase [Oscillospiraceae bacterium]
MSSLYQKFCKVSFDENGVLNKFEPVCPDNFNFSYDVVDEMARIAPEQRAMIWCNDKGEEHIYSFKDMSEYSSKTANYFSDLGIGKGDTVLVILKRHYQFWFTILALHKLGAVIVPATNLLTEKDIVYRCDMAQIKAVVCSGEDAVANHVETAEPKLKAPIIKISAMGSRDGWDDFDAGVEAASAEFARRENSKDDDMLLYFSSGTTGYPKMVMHSYTYPIGHIITGSFWHDVKDTDIHLTVAETGWGKAVWGKLYGQWLAGATVFVYDFDKFTPKDLLEKIEKYHITTFCAPPTIYRFFIKEGMEGYDLSSLRYATTAGEALNPEVYNRFFEYTGLRLMEGFGQTETTLALFNAPGTTPKPGSMGKPSPLYDVRLVDEDYNPVAPGQVGEITIYPNNTGNVGLFKRYHLNPESTEAAWAGGIYHTGDTAWMDEDGYYWYVGRTDDVIKASGYRIGPFEIESVLMEHPAVLECAVTGAPDPVRGQVVKATIVLMKGYEGSDELVKELQNYVKKQTAPYKYPRIVEFVNELPKTISGKIRRVEIRNQDKSKA